MSADQVANVVARGGGEEEDNHFLANDWRAAAVYALFHGSEVTPWVLRWQSTGVPVPLLPGGGAQIQAALIRVARLLAAAYECGHDQGTWDTRQAET